MRGIVTLCGSTRFYETFDEVSLALTLADYAVFSLGSHRGSDSMQNPKVAEKWEQVGQLHKDKIKMSQAIVIVNPGGYYGDDTKEEIRFAKELGKPIYYYALPQEFGGWTGEWPPQEFDGGMGWTGEWTLLLNGHKK